MENKEIKVNYEISERLRNKKGLCRLIELRAILDAQQKEQGRVDQNLLDEFCKLSQEVYAFED